MKSILWVVILMFVATHFSSCLNKPSDPNKELPIQRQEDYRGVGPGREKNLPVETDDELNLDHDVFEDEAF